MSNRLSSLTSDKIIKIIESKRNIIERFLDAYGPDFLYVLVSGGKDSEAVWALVNSVTRSYVAVYLHIAGQTHVDNVSVVYETARMLNVRDVASVRVDATREIMARLSAAIESCSLPCLLHVIVFTHYGEDYWKAMLRYGYPAPFSRFGWGVRWCCGTFKHRVFGRLPFNGRMNGLPWRFGADGVKDTDSPHRRKKYTSDVITWEKTRDTYLFPLRGLTDNDVWSILRYYGLYEIVYRQYEKWGRSPNCMFCPMVGRRDLIEKTVKAMPPAARRLLRETLLKLKPRYKETTYSYKSITKWLEVLDIVEKEADSVA